MLPQVSVIICAYNAQETIETCLNSVLQQTCRDIEVIVLNDGSTDDTAKIVRRFEDPRILLAEQQNTGLPQARKNALALAKGEYICFVDSDDWIEAEMLSTMLEKAKSLQADLVGCRICEHWGG